MAAETCRESAVGQGRRTCGFLTVAIHLRWGAHAPSRALVGVLADHTATPAIHRLGAGLLTVSDRRGRRSEHARARVLPDCGGGNCCEGPAYTSSGSDPGRV